MGKSYRFILIVFLFLVNSAYAQQEKKLTLESLLGEITQLKQQQAQQQAEIDKLKKENKDLQSQIVGDSTYSYSANILSLEQSLKELREDFYQATGTSRGSQYEIPEIQKKVTNLEETVKKMQGSSNGWNIPNLSDLSRRLDRLEDDVSDIAGPFSAFSQSSISGLSSSFSSLERKVGNLERRISSLEGKIK